MALLGFLILFPLVVAGVLLTLSAATGVATGALRLVRALLRSAAVEARRDDGDADLVAEGHPDVGDDAGGDGGDRVAGLLDRRAHREALALTLVEHQAQGRGEGEDEED